MTCFVFFFNLYSQPVVQKTSHTAYFLLILGCSNPQCFLCHFQRQRWQRDGFYFLLFFFFFFYCFTDFYRSRKNRYFPNGMCLSRLLLWNSQERLLYIHDDILSTVLQSIEHCLVLHTAGKNCVSLSSCFQSYFFKVMMPRLSWANIYQHNIR